MRIAPGIEGGHNHRDDGGAGRRVRTVTDGFARRDVDRDRRHGRGGGLTLLRKTPARCGAVVLAALGLLAVGNTAVGSLTGVRLKFWKDDVWYRSVITPVNGIPAMIVPVREIHFEVDVRNSGVRRGPRRDRNRSCSATTGGMTPRKHGRVRRPFAARYRTTSTRRHVRVLAKVAAPPQPGATGCTSRWCTKG
jgi:hypothetical protein